MRMGESTTQMTVDGGRRDCELAWSARRKKMGAKATPTRWKRVRGVENVMKFGVRRSVESILREGVCSTDRRPTHRRRSVSRVRYRHAIESRKSTYIYGLLVGS